MTPPQTGYMTFHLCPWTGSSLLQYPDLEWSKEPKDVLSTSTADESLSVVSGGSSTHECGNVPILEKNYYNCFYERLGF